MRTGLVSAMVVSGSFVLTAGTFAASTPGTGDNPYGAITLRNVFDLRPTPIIAPAEPAKEPPPNVDLIGLTTILKYPQAVFAIHEKGKPAPVTFIMKEGERQGSLEVVKIDMPSKTARVKIDDRAAELELVEPKGPSAPTSAGIAPVLGGNAGRVGYIPQPGAVAPPMTGGGLPANTYPVPAVNPMANPGLSPAVNPYAAANTAYPNAANPLGVSSGTPTRPVRTDQNISPEQQILLMEAQRAKAIQMGSPIANLLPSTPLTPIIQQENQPQQQRPPTAPPPPSMPGFLQPTGTGTLGPMVPR
jgi:hypothetical protein